ncbi:MAG: VWA domain-containing protein [Alphaproteobacteria bacterium]|nr:VWA domain-containing protein [Alphaproteobacteria bacterium]
MNHFQFQKLRRSFARDEFAAPLANADWVGRAGGLLGLVSLIALMSLAGCSNEEEAGAAKVPDPATPVVKASPQQTNTPPSPSGLAVPHRDVRTFEAGQSATARRHAHQPGGELLLPPPHALPAPAAIHASNAAPPMPTPPSADRFTETAANGYVDVALQPVSTFSIDVDTASYAVMRRFLRGGTTPPAAAVRVEEMINYFPYAYPAPADRSQPFSVTTTVMPSPWNAENQVLHIALRGYDLPQARRPRANIVLLVDVSGSMMPADRLPLLQQSFRMLVDELRPDDRVSMVTYANGVSTVLEPTAASDKATILGAIDRLNAGGGTAGGDGIQRAYALAKRNFDRDGVNRVVLATDGDFNLGLTDPKELERYVATQRRSGVYLSVLGVGLGNLNDALMQRLAQAGNGNAAYIDSLLEARKALKESFASTMFPIADDVKIQVEFNPAFIAGYRLIGYESRMLKREDFNNDAVDAGDIGAGHTVTAMYELTPVGGASRAVDPLRYQRETTPAPAPDAGGELAFVKLRYKLPGESASRLIAQPVEARAAHARLQAAPAEARFALAVAMFGERLRRGGEADGPSYGDIERLARESRGEDVDGYRGEFIQLVRMADTMKLVGQR